MKKLILTITLLTTIGCGLAKQQICGPLDMAAGCNAFFGDDTDRLNEHEEALLRLQQAQAELNVLLNLKVSSEYVQNAINEAYVRLANILDSKATIDLIDPCPSVPSSEPKEVIVRITKSSGVEYLAYMEHSGTSQRFLTKLSTGVPYKTTDSRTCPFTL